MPPGWPRSCWSAAGWWNCTTSSPTNSTTRGHPQIAYRSVVGPAGPDDLSGTRRAPSHRRYRPAARRYARIRRTAAAGGTVLAQHHAHRTRDDAHPQAAGFLRHRRRRAFRPDETRSDPRRAALDAVGRWRARAEHPLNDPFTSRLCLAAVRSAEGILTQLSAHDRPAY